MAKIAKNDQKWLKMPTLAKEKGLGFFTSKHNNG